MAETVPQRRDLNGQAGTNRRRSFTDWSTPVTPL